MMSSCAAPLAALLLILAGGESLAAPNSPSPMPRVKAQMTSVVDKTSTDLFNTAGAADPVNGPDQQRPDAAGWVRLRAQAQALKAVGDWLQDPKNGKPSEQAWRLAAEAMSAKSAAAEAAASAHDAESLAQAANDLSDTCGACHKIYKRQDGG